MSELLGQNTGVEYLDTMAQDNAVFTQRWTSQSRCMDKINREMTEIELHPNISREDGFSLSR
jgi:hypothetical protein